MAEQQGKYLARVLNEGAARLDPAEPAPFVYRHMGSMASLGEPGAAAAATLHVCMGEPSMCGFHLPREG